MTNRFWPISISGAAAIFFAGVFSLSGFAFLLDGRFEVAAAQAALVWLLLHHAAQTARGSMLNGTYRIGMFGIRSAGVGHDTRVSDAKPKTGEAA